MTLPADLIAELDDSRQVVAGAEGFEFTKGELNTVFSQVQNDLNWKNPVLKRNVVLPSRRAVVAMREAIVFFTGSRDVTIQQDGWSIHQEPTYTVRAEGYYNAIGA